MLFLGVLGVYEQQARHVCYIDIVNMHDTVWGNNI
jgi:hypothetical protein